MIRVTFACFVLLLVPAAVSSAANAEDDADKNYGKEAVESVSGPASTKDAERSVQSDHENDSPIRVAVKSSSGARDEHESARFAMRSNRMCGGLKNRMMYPGGMA